MYPCSNPELVAAASNAGGLGVIQPVSLTFVHGYEFRDGIQKIRSLTDKPVGMNALIEKSSKRYLKRMVRRYKRLERLRMTSPEEYERVIAVDRMEGESRRLGRRVRQLDRALLSGEGNREALLFELDRAVGELRKLVEDTFARKQQSQLIEINRLEAEVRELRRLVEQREANRERVVERRFLELTGRAGGQGAGDGTKQAALP